MTTTKSCLLAAAPLLLLLALSLALGKAQAGFGSEALTADATPTCTEHQSSMTLWASPATPQVGDTLLVTATLSNVGSCGMLGLPLYRLTIQSSQAQPILAPDSPEPTLHRVPIWPGESDSTAFTLQVVGSGTVTLTVSASFEVHLGYPGPAYWSGDSAGPLTLTVPARRLFYLPLVSKGLSGASLAPRE